MQFGSILGTIALIISLYILWEIQGVILLGFAAVVFATVINRLVQPLERLKLPRGVAVILALFAILIVVAGLLSLAAPPVVRQFQDLIQQIPVIADQVTNWTGWLQRRLPLEVAAYIRNLDSTAQDLQMWIERLFGNFFSIFFSTLGVMINAVLFTFVTIMLLLNPQPYRRGFILLFPSFYRDRVDQILDQCESTLTGWATGVLFNMTVIGILSATGLWILGVPLPLANAILAATLALIPNLGPVLSVIPPALLGFLEAPWRGVAVIILYIVIQQIESNILTPLVMQRQVSILPAVTLLSLAAFGLLFGVLGLFLALPIVVVAQVWITEVLIHDVFDPWQKARSQSQTPSQAPPDDEV
ncbi:MAG: AI-2E family transporter [Thainema sp.]